MSPGSCFFLPHGAKIYNNLVDFLRSCYQKLGYQEVITPNLYNKKLWETSGHWDKYKENMFLIHKQFDGDEEGAPGARGPDTGGHCGLHEGAAKVICTRTEVVLCA